MKRGPGDGRVPRRRVDLGTLPAWAQYLIALIVVAVIGGAAWLIGRGRPTPSWFQGAIPVLGWIGVAALAYLVVRQIIKKR
ncbi:MAG TPA: hypothetical protein VIO62_01155 [Candidatus Dormibacteraeota bacterium]